MPSSARPEPAKRTVGAPRSVTRPGSERARDVGVVSPRGADEQQGFTGDVEAAVLWASAAARWPSAIASILRSGQCCMGHEDRKIDISRFSDLLEPREKGRRFGV